MTDTSRPRRHQAEAQPRQVQARHLRHDSRYGDVGLGRHRRRPPDVSAGPGRGLRSASATGDRGTRCAGGYDVDRTAHPLAPPHPWTEQARPAASCPLVASKHSSTACWRSSSLISSWNSTCRPDRRPWWGDSAVVFDLVLIGLAIALDPLPLSAFLVVLPSKRGKKKGAAFVLGWLASLAIVVTVTVLTTGNNPPEPDTAPSLADLAVKIAIGVGLVAIAVRQRRRMGRPQKPKKPPKWQASRPLDA